MTLEDHIRLATAKDAKAILQHIRRGATCVQYGLSTASWRKDGDALHIMHYTGRLADLPKFVPALKRDMVRLGVTRITWDGRKAWSRICERTLANG